MLYVLISVFVTGYLFVAAWIAAKSKLAQPTRTIMAFLWLPMLMVVFALAFRKDADAK